MCASALTSKRKPSPPLQDTVGVLQRLFEKGDPLLASAMILGATAAYGGLTPPFTRLLKAFAEGNISSDLEGAAQSVSFGVLGGIGVVPGLLFGWIFKEDDSETEKRAKVSAAALAAAGAVEVYLMAQIMKQPEVLKSIIAAPAEVLKGIGEIVPDF